MVANPKPEEGNKRIVVEKLSALWDEQKEKVAEAFSTALGMRRKGNGK